MPFELGALAIDYVRRRVTVGGREPTEADRVRAFVKQLRAKLGDDAARPAYILTERGVGYRMPRPGEE